ncbi:MAG: aldo/keto reductase [Polyangiaceae bacterium]
MNSIPEPWYGPREVGAPALVAVGAMNFGKRTPKKEAERVIARALERGCTYFDTANAYYDGESEKILGAALAKKRGEVKIATKVGLLRTGNKVEGLARATILDACDKSLARLGTDYVDVYYLHAPDPSTRIEETLGAIESLLKTGKIRHFGVSNYASWQILEIMNLCDEASMPRPVLSQQIYNLLIRQLEIEYFKFTKRYAVHTTVYNVLAGGLLAREHQRETITAGSRFDKNPMYQRRYWSEHFFHYVESLRALAAEEKLSLAALAYAWNASRPGVDSLLVGPASVEQLDFALDAVAHPLPPSIAAKVEELHRAFTGTDASYAR